MTLLPLVLAEPVLGMPDNVLAWTTTRANGSFGMGSEESVGAVMDRWTGLQNGLAALRIDRLATAHQVHGAVVERHEAGWRGWLRVHGVDGHVTTTPGTALAVTINEWTHPYSREQAAYPLPWVRASKFWPSVGRIDNPYGDRNLICICPPMEAYA